MTDNRHYGAPLRNRIRNLFGRGRDQLVMVYRAALMGDPDENTTWDLATAIAHRELHIALGWVPPDECRGGAFHGPHPHGGEFCVECPTCLGGPWAQHGPGWCPPTAHSADSGALSSEARAAIDSQLDARYGVLDHEGGEGGN